MSFLRVDEFLRQDQEKPRILVVTACGRKKHDKPMAAWKLYKSTRIKAVYNRTMRHDMGILSAKYGLIKADKVIEPYEAVMDEEKAEEFVKQGAKILDSYDYVVYFKGGARKEYLDCIKEVCQKAGKTLIALGYANMGGINKIPKVLELVEKGEFDKISSMNHTEINDFYRAI